MEGLGPAPGRGGGLPTKAVRRYEDPRPQESLLYSYLGQCGECSCVINGTLYACRICPGNEWCEACAKGTNHPIDHPFVRISLQSELIADGQLTLDIEGQAAQEVWSRCKQFSPIAHGVPFLTFVDQLSKYNQEDITHGQLTALEAIFGDISRQKEISLNSLDITDLEYALFVKRFGPINLCLKKVMQVLTDGRVWFHGNMDLTKATSIFRGKPNKSFIIRYSSRTPGAFSINYVKDNEMKIFNRITNNMEGEGLYVHADKQKLQYSSFAAFITSNSHIFAYPVEDPLNSFLLVKKRQLRDMGPSCDLPYTFNNTKPRSHSLSSTADDFYDALARKADGFSTQMACSPPTGMGAGVVFVSSPPGDGMGALQAPVRRSKSASPGHKKTRHHHQHHQRQQGDKKKQKQTTARRLDEEEDEEAGRARRHQRRERGDHRGEGKGAVADIPLVVDRRGRKPFVPGAHYTSFYSDDENEELPNIHASGV